MQSVITNEGYTYIQRFYWNFIKGNLRFYSQFWGAQPKISERGPEFQKELSTQLLRNLQASLRCQVGHLKTTSHLKNFQPNYSKKNQGNTPPLSHSSNVTTSSDPERNSADSHYIYPPPSLFFITLNLLHHTRYLHEAEGKPANFV